MQLRLMRLSFEESLEAREVDLASVSGISKKLKLY